MADKETGTPQFDKYHVLRFKDGSYDYQCSRGLSAMGPWDQRPRFCAGVCCGRELVEPPQRYQFAGPTESDCRKQARACGWTIRRTEAICPRCSEQSRKAQQQ